LVPERKALFSGQGALSSPCWTMTKDAGEC
jgi:hypothetical protein